jgi:hypothetical protein
VPYFLSLFGFLSPKTVDFDIHREDDVCQMVDDIWKWVERASAVIALVGVPYLVNANRQRVPRFSFKFTASRGELFERDGLEWCRFAFSGTVRNQSLDHNSVQNVRLVVWRKRGKAYRTFGYTPTKITEHGEVIQEPLSFGPREARKLDIEFEVALTGTHERQLVYARKKISDEPEIYKPVHEYELCFEDINGNLFDKDGLPCNRKGADLRWTLENTFIKLKEGNPVPLIRHAIKILVSDGQFAIKRAIRWLGF